MTEDELRSVNRRLRKDLRKAIRVARSWKEHYVSLCWCTHPDHAKETRCAPVAHKYGHWPRTEKV